MPTSSRPDALPSTAKRWLTIVGIGEDGPDGLSPSARAAIGAAAHVFGGRRHLALAAPLVKGIAHPWPSPFDRAVEAVRELKGEAVCVLASGDPFLHGVGATLSRVIPADEMRTLPAPSAFSLAAARLGWPLQEVETASLHGRAVEHLRPLVHPGRRVLALTSDADGPKAIADLLVADGFGASEMIVLEALGGPRERVRTAKAAGFALADIDPLNLVAIAVAGGAEADVLPLTPGLGDDFFDHDGQITKREIRALTLAALAPRRGELLWDVGAGSGSIAIEWMLRHPSLMAIAVERDGERAARASQNAARLGVPGLRVVHGEAPEALAPLPRPDAVFVGGGGSRDGVMETAIAALKPGGRLVANAVTLEMEAVLIALRATHGGELARLAIARAGPVGTMSGWRPAMPVTQWSWVKP